MSRKTKEIQIVAVPEEYLERKVNFVMYHKKLTASNLNRPQPDETVRQYVEGYLRKEITMRTYVRRLILHKFPSKNDTPEAHEAWFVQAKTEFESLAGREFPSYLTNQYQSSVSLVRTRDSIPVETAREMMVRALNGLDAGFRNAAQYALLEELTNNNLGIGDSGQKRLLREFIRDVSENGNKTAIKSAKELLDGSIDNHESFLRHFKRRINIEH